MAKGKRKRAELSVFKGREAKLNHAIFQILALKGPLAIYDICKQVKKQKLLHRKLYSTINRRVRKLENRGFIEKAGTRKTLAGFTVTLYQLFPKGYLAILLNQTDLDILLEKTDETTIIELIAALAKKTSVF